MRRSLTVVAVRRATVAAFAALQITTAAACGASCEPDPPARREASPLVTSPDGKIKAQALVTFSKGFEGVHSGRPDELFHVLAVESGGTTHEVELASFGGARLSPQPPGEYRAAVHATMTVQLAADGHAASVSSDGGKSFEHVVLDAGDPFLCGVDSPASEAPPTRELVLAGLKSKGILRHGDARA
ncbi:MAG TPA: hypothetical protein VL400_18275, partial [Polyangiaceae bacterium]|nr:hypothetical protein [Polyangiaceae bacterium]